MNPQPSALRYRAILEEIRSKAENCGRDPAKITLVVVTKGHSWDEILPVYEAGCRDFGENRVQEALPKISSAPDDCRWHFIGTLQKNKVNKVLPAFSSIHSVDSLELAKKISSSSLAEKRRTPIFLEVNTSGEPSKHGFNLQNCRESYQTIANLDGVSLNGLMTMAPFTQDKQRIRECFKKLRGLRDECGLQELSMGMTNDYPIAIEEGATFLRVGTAIFFSPLPNSSHEPKN